MSYKNVPADSPDLVTWKVTAELRRHGQHLWDSYRPRHLPTLRPGSSSKAKAAWLSGFGDLTVVWISYRLDPGTTSTESRSSLSQALSRHFLQYRCSGYRQSSCPLAVFINQFLVDNERILQQHQRSIANHFQSNRLFGFNISYLNSKRVSIRTDSQSVMHLHHAEHCPPSSPYTL